MKTRKYLLTLAYICLTLLTACADKQAATDQQKKIDQLESIRDLSTSRVGVITGVVYEEALSKEFPDMHVMYIDDEIGLLQSLQTHRCDAALFDEHTLKFHMQSISGIRILKEPYMTADVGAIFHPESEALRDEFNVFIRQLKADGTYDQLYEKWIEHGQTSHMSDIPLPTVGEPLRVATTSCSAPLVFIKDGKLVGLEVEIMTLFAQHINRPIEWWDMDFSGVLPAVVSKRCDAAVCSINYSEERAKNVIFSDTYFLCSSVVAVADDEVADHADNPFVQQVREIAAGEGAEVVVIRPALSRVNVFYKYAGTFPLHVYKCIYVWSVANLFCLLVVEYSQCRGVALCIIF